MFLPSEELRNEHEEILSGVEVLEKMVMQMEKGRNVEAKDILDILEFFNLFVDKCHHGKEDRLFFASLIKMKIPQLQESLNQLLVEHELTRKYFAGMLQAIQPSFIQKDFIMSAISYNRLIRNHIKKEDEDFFPLGDEKIPAYIQHQIMTCFEAFEEDAIGKGTHDKMHELLYNLQSKYL